MNFQQGNFTCIKVPVNGLWDELQRRIWGIHAVQTSCYCSSTESLAYSYNRRNWHRSTDECGLTGGGDVREGGGGMDGWMEERESVCAIVPVTVS